MHIESCLPIRKFSFVVLSATQTIELAWFLVAGFTTTIVDTAPLTLVALLISFAQANKQSPWPCVRTGVMRLQTWVLTTMM